MKPEPETAQDDSADGIRYFLTYRGVGLPLQLSGELSTESVGNRGTYFRAHYDVRGRLMRCEKFVYGEVELEHVYQYDTAGRLLQARITLSGEEPQVISFATRTEE
jgi:hypothetical protein